MARNRYYRSGRSSYQPSVGQRRAMEHIAAAKALSVELGGTDKDVKQYFFSLSGEQLNEILDEYEIKYGKSARDYAQKSMNKWSSGKVHMSGMVAERLFKLLPPKMPLEEKYKLTTSLWEHVGPSSNKTFYMSPNASLEEVLGFVNSHIENVAVNYEIPVGMQNRFNWLSQGDITVKQELLNYLREQEKQLVSIALEQQLGILTDHLKSSGGQYTNLTTQSLKVGKHQVHIVIDKEVEHGITEKRPDPIYPDSNQVNWFWWLLGGVLLLWFLNK